MAIGTILRAATAYFAMAFGAGFVLGTIRVPFIVPRIGERLAELAEMPIMAVVVYFSARYLVRRFEARVAARAWLGVGAIALGELLAAELLLAVLLQDRSLSEYLASRDPVSGAVYLAMLVVFAVMPWWHSQMRCARSGREEQ